MQPVPTTNSNSDHYNGDHIDGYVDNRVYLALKARAVACDFRPDEPILLKPLAKHLGVSTPPVRAALNMLVAEGLVKRAPQKGFIAISLSEDRFRGLYSLNQFLLDASLNTRSLDLGKLENASARVAVVLSILDSDKDCSPTMIARHTGRLFLSIAELSGNPHVIDSVNRINDSLCFMRALETRHLDETRAELTNVCELFLAEQFEATSGAIREYHAARFEALPLLLDALKR